MYYSCSFLLLASLLGLDQCFSNSDTRAIARWYERKFRIFFFKLKFRNLNCTIVLIVSQCREKIYKDTNSIV